jgi:CHASE3 domain sensor protein
MTIGKKLTLSFGGVIGVSLLMGGISLKIIYSLSSELSRAVNTSVNSIEQVGNLTTALAGMRSAEAGFILFSSLNDAVQSETERQRFRSILESAGDWPCGVERLFSKDGSSVRGPKVQ